MALLPVILRIFAKKSGVASESEIQSYVFGTHYTYQVVFVFFLTMLASAIFSSIDAIISSPTSIFRLLGETVPASGVFFTSYGESSQEGFDCVCVNPLSLIVHGSLFTVNRRACACDTVAHKRLLLLLHNQLLVLFCDSWHHVPRVKWLQPCAYQSALVLGLVLDRTAHHR
jgi:hypothetical protein